MQVPTASVSVPVDGEPENYTLDEARFLEAQMHVRPWLHTTTINSNSDVESAGESHQRPRADSYRN